MKACLGENVKISLLTASLPNEREKQKTLVIKGVSTEFADDKFKEILKLKVWKVGKMAVRSKCFNSN